MTKYCFKLHPLVMRIGITLATISGSAIAQDAKSSLPAAVIEMRSITFQPKSLTIHEGQSIQWWNVSYTDHSATANDGQSFDTNMVTPKNTSLPVLFSKPGKYTYHCKMHGRTMSGIVIVLSKKSRNAKRQKL
ncbi:MAG: hypothetical protein EOP04_07420 [Proteobacteria bacterium]|nr:MAG: hypothetical protein EOP04_07420 [Pseudomonadota bacterium]